MVVNSATQTHNLNTIYFLNNQQFRHIIVLIPSFILFHFITISRFSCINLCIGKLQNHKHHSISNIRGGLECHRNIHELKKIHFQIPENDPCHNMGNIARGSLHWKSMMKIDHFSISNHSKFKILFHSILNTLNAADLAIRFGQIYSNAATVRVHRVMRFSAKSYIESARTLSAQRGRSATVPTTHNWYCGGRGQE